MYLYGYFSFWENNCELLVQISEITGYCHVMKHRILLIWHTKNIHFLFYCYNFHHSLLLHPSPLLYSYFFILLFLQLLSIPVSSLFPSHTEFY